MSNTPDFIQKQYEFTRHCRDPENSAAPENIEDRRMQIYRDLLFNNVESFMANNFPVIRELLADDHWQCLIRDYFSNHKATTPYFPKLPGEFLRFLEDERESTDDPIFLSELAHYEWMESVVSIDTREIPSEGIDFSGDLLTGVPIINPIIRLLAYQFPVHKIGPDFLPDASDNQPTYLVVYRDRADKVGFMELNMVTARLLDLLTQGLDLRTLDHLKSIAQDLQHPDPDVVIQGGMDVLKQMRDRDIVLGVKPL